ncbi:MAG: YlbF family regulator [Gemmatimonadales bacterium]|nr:MAG: YlbF family regulator [Gemmatimonadales bacterium]
MSKIQEMAMDLGQALGRTDEYQALRRAAQSADEDRELTELRNELQNLEAELMATLRGGHEPSEEDKDRYEELARQLQAKPMYQRLVAAQTNFDKVLQIANETISQGIEQGSKGRIILPS